MQAPRRNCCWSPDCHCLCTASNSYRSACARIWQGRTSLRPISAFRADFSFICQKSQDLLYSGGALLSSGMLVKGAWGRLHSFVLSAGLVSFGRANFQNPDDSCGFRTDILCICGISGLFRIFPLDEVCRSRHICSCQEQLRTCYRQYSRNYTATFEIRRRSCNSGLWNQAYALAGHPFTRLFLCADCPSIERIQPGVSFNYTAVFWGSCALRILSFRNAQTMHIFAIGVSCLDFAWGKPADSFRNGFRGTSSIFPEPLDHILFRNSLFADLAKIAG